MKAAFTGKMRAGKNITVTGFIKCGQFFLGTKHKCTIHALHQYCFQFKLARVQVIQVLLYYFYFTNWWHSEFCPVTRSGSRGMLNLSMVHQYKFNPQMPVRDMSSDKEAPTQTTHLLQGMVNGPVVGTTDNTSSTSSIVCSTSSVSFNSLPVANSTCSLGGKACFGTVPAKCPNPPANITNTAVASLQQSHFPLLTPLPLRQPYVTAIPVYSPPNLCPFYMPPEGQAVQTGIPIMPGAHNIMQCPPIYSLMQYCSLPVENNCGQTLTDLACGGINLPCFNSASFELQRQGRNDSVSTCSTSISHPGDHVATCSTNVGHQEDHDAACSASVGFKIGTNSSSSTVHQEDHVGSNSTSDSHHRNHIGTSSTINGLQRGHVGASTSTNVGHQSNNEAMFSISSLLPQMSSESESTGNSTSQGAMQFARKGKFKAFCPPWRDLQIVLSRVSKRDIADYRWLTDQACESLEVSSMSSLKNFIRTTEKRLKNENDQLLKSSAKFEHLISTYQGNINRDAGKYEKVAKQLRAAEKRSVSHVEAELNDLLIKMKFLFDDIEVLERKWYNKDGTLLVANSILKQNLTSGGLQLVAKHCDAPLS